jgi:hypothetical protein
VREFGRFMRQIRPKMQVLSPEGSCGTFGVERQARPSAAGTPSGVGVDLTGGNAYLTGTGAPAAAAFAQGVTMSSFDDRKKGQEAKFALDAELRFKAEARRNKLLGIWAAELMGMSGDEAKNYAAEVVAADFEEAGDEDVFRKVTADVKAKGLSISETQIREKMLQLTEVARAQVLAEG